MADGRTDEARGAPGQPAPVDLRAQINRAYASSAPIVQDEPETRRAPAGGGQPTAPLPETAARFAAAMAAVEQQQAAPEAGRSGSGGSSVQWPAAAGAPPRGAQRPQRPVAPTPAPVPASAASTSASGPAGSGVRRPRRARLRLTHVDPWSVMKTSLLLSIALGIVTVVAVAVIWAVLNASGLWDSINQTVGEVVGTEASADFRVQDYVGTERVLGFTMLVAAVDVVLITVVATLGAFLYNLAAALLGGLEVVLAEDEH